MVRIEKSVLEALANYSNVHRGSGHNSLVSTRLYEYARHVVLDYLELSKKKYTVVFCSPLRAELLTEQTGLSQHRTLSSEDVGLPLGIRAVAVKKKALKGDITFHTGGGTARLVAPEWVIWARGADRYEAGTPSVINVITFARALQLAKKHGENLFTGRELKHVDINQMIWHDSLDNSSGNELLDKLSINIMGRNNLVPTSQGFMTYINLDYSASTSPFETVWRSARISWDLDDAGRKAVVQEVRSICSDFLGAPPEKYNIIFTSNATEALNIAAEGLRDSETGGYDNLVLSSLLEHSSNDLPWRFTTKSQMIRLGIDSEGFIDLDEMESFLEEYNRKDIHGKKRIRLVAISGASNVLGTYNDITEIARLAHRYGALLLVDAAQLIAHRKINMAESDIDFLAFSAHKMYAPFGSGALVSKNGLLSFGAGYIEKAVSSGEENTAGLAAMGKAMVLLGRVGMDIISERERRLTTQVLSEMKSIPGISIFGVTDITSPRFASRGGVIAFSLNKPWPHKLAPMLAEKGGIGVRSGCHCAHILVKHLVGVTPRLEKFQRLMLSVLPKLSLPGIVRLSFGIGTTREDIDRFIQTVRKIAASPDERDSHTKRIIDEFVDSVTRKVYEAI